MKRNIVVAAIMSLFVLSIAVSAQKAPNFSGTWNLDVSKSKLGDRNNIESQIMSVTQTAADIKVSTTTKRTPPPAGAPAGGGGRPGGGGGDNTMTYTLDGKATIVQQDMRGTSVPVTLTGKWDGTNLNLSRSFTITTPNGEFASSSKETWMLGADGSSLTVNRDSTGRNGTNSTTMVYTRNK